MNFTAAVRLHFDRIEVQSYDVLRVTQKQVHEFLVSLHSVLRHHASHFSFQAYSLAVGFHGTPEGDLSARDFLSRFTAAPPDGLGQPLGSGAVFYYGPQDGRVTSSLTIDLSSVLQNACYLKAEAIWDATRVSVDEFEKKGLEYVNTALKSIGLELREE
jgi:hypothetical protein